eukprot:SAG31_NODE_10251_length_1164_cov_1.708920_1_plen_251_part_00
MSDANLDSSASLLLTDGLLLYNVLEHAEWRVRALLPLLSKQCYAFSQLDGHWHFLARCACREYHLYVPPIDCFVDRALFMELWTRRFTFLRPPLPDELLVKPGDFSVTVCARFRPAVDSAGGEESRLTKTVVPLHQRIQQVQAAKKVSRKKALQLVMSAQRAALLGPGAGETGAVAGQGDEVAAVDAQQTGVINLDQTAPRGQVLAIAPGVGLREFNYSKVFGPGTAQRDVYDGAARRLVMDFVNGVSGN